MIVCVVAPARPGPALVLATLAGALLGWITVARPSVWAGPYRVWNALARHARSAVLFYLLALCYFLVFPVASRAGSRLVLGRDRGRGSMWTPRTALERGAYLAEGHVAPSRTPDGARGYLGWLSRSGNWWALGIFAFLKLIAAHSPSHGRPPANIYTLY